MSTADSAVSTVLVSTLHPWKLQPRQHFDEGRYQELLTSVKQHGVLQSLVARPRSAGGFEVICGERRWRAAKEAGLDSVPVSIRSLTDLEALVLALEENTKRNDLNAIEEAEAYERLHTADPVYDDAGIAARFGKPVAYVRRRRRLVNLDKSAREAVVHGVLTPAHADLLATVPAGRQREVFLDGCFIGMLRPQIPALMKAGDWGQLRQDVASISSLRQVVDRVVRRDLDDVETQERLPELAPAMEEAAKSGQALLELSEDYQLTPAQRKAAGADVLGRKDYEELDRFYGPKTCPYARRGVIVHGGAPRLLKVCIDPKCPVHHPPPPPRGTSVSGSRSHTSGSKKVDTYEAKRRQWSLTKKAAMRAMAPALLKATLTSTVAKLIVGYGLKEIEQNFGLTLTDKTAAAFIIADYVNSKAWDRSAFDRAAKAVKFDLAKFEREQKKLKGAKKKLAKKISSKKAKKK